MPKRHPKPGPQGSGKSKFAAFTRPRQRGPAYILEDDPNWTEEVREAKLAEMRAFANERGPVPGAPFIIFEYADGRRIRLDRNP